MSSITLLGTGTCEIELERRAASVLVKLDGLHVLFDCGHGVLQRLLEFGVQHKDIEHVVLSHFHPDHVSDLVPLFHAGAWSRSNPRSTDLHIYGPPGVQKLIDGFVGIFGRRAFEKPSYSLVVHEVSEEFIQIGPGRFEFVSLPPAGNHGLRFEWDGKRCAITGDSDFHEAEIAFLKDVDLAVIDAGHITDEQIIELAVASRAKTIVCSHLYREINADHLQTQAEQRGYQGTIEVGQDLESFVI
jgi:ribonuclease BN (tRNA processing enzyme)